MNRDSHKRTVSLNRSSEGTQRLIRGTARRSATTARRSKRPPPGAVRAARAGRRGLPGKPGAAGAKGEKGDKGDKGDPGVANLETDGFYRTVDASTAEQRYAVVTAKCAAARYALSGGLSPEDGLRFDGLSVIASRPSVAPGNYEQSPSRAIRKAATAAPKADRPPGVEGPSLRLGLHCGRRSPRGRGGGWSSRGPAGHVAPLAR